MRVLHISLGWPPYRTGGLVRYCCDLLNAQIAAGYEVAMLWPAGNTFFKQAIIRKVKRNGIGSYEFYSRNMIPLIFGTKDPSALDCADDTKAFNYVLNDFRPDVVHIHSIQGMSVRLFEEMRSKGIRTVFTTHDYYPICLRCNFINQTGRICGGPSPELCAICNASGLSASKAAIMQSRIYQNVKDSTLFRYIRRTAKSSLEFKEADNRCMDKKKIQQYEAALKNNHESIAMVDIIHANSKLSASYYKKAFPNSQIEILAITHAGLMGGKAKTKKRNDSFIIGYVGGANIYKGYRVLLQSLSKLPDTLKWELHFYGTPPSAEEIVPKIRSKVKCMGFYKQNEANQVFRGFDVLVVPSIWPETFGFVVVEALSVGTPVICSNQVGASDLVCAENRYAYNDADGLTAALQFATTQNSDAIIQSKDFVSSMSLHQKKLERLYFSEKSAK